MASCTSSQAAAWVDEIQQWLNAGISEEEIERRLQARVPGFSLSPDPGGRWDWLLGSLALAVAAIVLLLIARGTVRKSRSRRVIPESTESGTEAAEEWQDRLDDELLEFS